ncbi:MAG: hypothetical protein HOP10_07085 [Chitinophagaceae bacterium]|nr:hypothetical protein [Chitinophagaceae bacterium]
MKKIIYLLSFLVLSKLTLAQPGQQTITVSLINDAELTASIRNLFNGLSCNQEKVVNYSGIPSFNESDFDFTAIYESQKTGKSEIAYSVKHKASTGNSDFAFSVFMDKGVLKNPMLIATISDRSKIVYHQLEENKSFEVSNIDKVVTYSSHDVDYGGETKKGSGCGNCVSNCISDAYTNHGWVSVWAFIQSIFVPATGVGIAIGCIASCCN